MGAILDAMVPPIVVAFRTKPGELFATFNEAGKKVRQLDEETQHSMTGGQKAAAGLAEVGKKALFGLATATFTGGAAAVKLAGDYQEATTQLVTGAGESEKNIDMVRKGILKMAPAVAQGPVALAQGMYMVESAGYHGAKGLAVLKAAAQGATVGATDTKTVADALTTVLTDYHLPAEKAADVTSKLVATVASGKTTMADLASSIHNVAPQAASAGVSLQQMLGAIATMTGQGISADQATQDLKNTIQSLQNPTQMQVTEMDALGLSAANIEHNIGKRGLTGTLGVLEGALAKHMRLGSVWLSTYNHLQEQTAKVNTMFQALPANMKPFAKQIEKGTITGKQYRHAIMGMNLSQRQLIQQFKAGVDRSRGFNEVLSKGGASSQTFGAALAKLTGGATGMNVALALGGKNASTFADNVKHISATTADANGNVHGMAEASKDFNFKLHQLTASAQVLAINIGNKLIPIIEGAVTWFTRHKWAVKALAYVVGAFAAVTIAFYLRRLAVMVKTTVKAYADMIKGGVKWVAEHAKRIGQFIADQYRAQTAKEDATAALGKANEEEVASTETSQNQMARLQQMMDQQRQRSAQIAQETAQQTAQANRLIAESEGKAAAATETAAAKETTADEEAAAAADTEAGRIGAADARMAAANEEAAASGGKMGAGLGKTKMGALGTVAAIGLAAVGVYKLGKHMSNYFERNVAGAKSFGQLNSSLDALRTSLVNNGAAAKDTTTQWIQAQVQAAGLDRKAAASGITMSDLTNAIQGGDKATYGLIQRWKASGKPADSTIAALLLLEQGYHRTTDKVLDLSQRMKLIPSTIHSKISVDTSQAMWAFQSIGSAFASLQNGLTAHVNVSAGLGGRTGTAFAGGGWVRGPGGFTSDRIPAWLSNGEYVLSHDMLNGRSPISPAVTSAVLANSAQAHLGSLSRPIDNGNDKGAPTIVVEGSVIDMEGLFQAVQTAALRHGGRNSQTWAPFKRG